MNLDLYDCFINLLLTAKECAVAILPLLITFIFFQIFFIRMDKHSFLRIITGMAIAYVGIVLLMFGLNFGYVPYATAFGLKISEISYKWVIVPIAFILGFIITTVEPSVSVLTSDIDRESSGAINKKVILYTLAIGVGISLSLAMLKILLNIPLWYILIPGYAIAIILAFFSSEKFTSIAFDSGGVATGIMTTTFLLAIALGLAEGMPNSNPVTDGFGLIAIVAMTPIILVLLLGKLFDISEHKKGGKKNGMGK